MRRCQNFWPRIRRRSLKSTTSWRSSKRRPDSILARLIRLRSACDTPIHRKASPRSEQWRSHDGTFNAGAIVAAGRLAANGKYAEQKYQGKTIYVFTLDRQVKLLGLWDIRVGDLAVTSLDGNTLALGDLEASRKLSMPTGLGKRQPGIDCAGQSRPERRSSDLAETFPKP